MTRRSQGDTYPPDWPAIARRVKDEAGWSCVRCQAYHDPPRVVLTVHHADMKPAHSGPEWWFNLLPLCTRCHLSIQGRVDLDRPWVFVPHSPWFREYVAGFYALKYLGVFLSRAEVKERLEELLALEARAVLDGSPVALEATQ